jgi:hypothetical protein
MTGPLQADVRRLEKHIDRLEERLSKVETRINIAIGAVSVFGMVGTFNLITNLVQSGVVQAMLPIN